MLNALIFSLKNRVCTNFIIGALGLFSEISTQAKDISVAPVAVLQQIADNKTWQHLVFLQYGKPEIKEDKFYLSGKQQVTPYFELVATLEEFKNNPQRKCDFPARYYWLSTQLQDEYLKHGLIDCQKVPTPLKNFSMLLISGYLKNPVSTFGHILVTIQAEDNNRLLSESYNYGAKVPDDENGLVYAFKGVFGLYPAIFEQWQYFRHEAYYVTGENRDIWEYQLDLNDFEKKILTYHLHELTKFNVNYYFFKQNCAYRTGELLEFIYGLQVTHRKTAWYAPDYVLSQLVDFHNESDRKIIKKEVFRPSDQSKIYALFERLRPQLRQVVNQTLLLQDLTALHSLSEDDYHQTVRFLMMYTGLKSKDPTKQSKYHKLRTLLVQDRMSKPAQDHLSEDQTSFYKVSPANGPKPSKLNVAVGTGVGVDFSMYQRDPLNDGTELGMHFSAMALKYRWTDQQDQFALDIIHARKLTDLSLRLHGEQKWSWEVRAGVQSDPFDLDRTQYFGQASAGVAYNFGQHWLAYQLYGVILHNQAEVLDTKINTGLLYKSKRISAQFEYENIFRNNAYYDDVSLILRKKIEKNMDVNWKWSKAKNQGAQLYLGLGFYW